MTEDSLRTEIDTIYRTEYQQLARLASAIVYDSGLGDDIVSGGMVRLVENWDKVRKYDAPGAWLRRVVIRDAVRIQAKRTKERSMLTELFSSRPEYSPPTDAPSALRSAVDQLPTKMRAVVLVHYFMDQSIVETANLLGIKEGTAKAHLHRAKQTLREVMTDQDVETAR